MFVVQEKFFEADEINEYLKRLPCQISAIKFAGNSVALCVPEKSSEQICLQFLLTFASKFWELKDRTK